MKFRIVLIATNLKPVFVKLIFWVFIFYNDRENRFWKR